MSRAPNANEPTVGDLSPHTCHKDLVSVKERSSKIQVDILFIASGRLSGRVCKRANLLLDIRKETDKELKEKQSMISSPVSLLSLKAHLAEAALVQSGSATSLLQGK